MIAKALNYINSQQLSQYIIQGSNNSSNAKASSLEPFDYQHCAPKVSYNFLVSLVSYSFLVGLVSNSFLVSLVS